MELKKYHSITVDGELIEVLLPEGYHLMLHALIDYFLLVNFNSPRKPTEKEYCSTKIRYVVIYLGIDLELGIDERFQILDSKTEKTHFITIPDILRKKRQTRIKNLL